MSVKIWHNPRCRKSREGLQLVESRGIEPEIRKYLEDAPSAAEIREVLEKMGMSPRKLLRTNEAEYRDLGLKDKAKTDEELIKAMAGHPKLIERPVVIAGDKAVLGRPAEKLEDFLDSL